MAVSEAGGHRSARFSGAGRRGRGRGSGLLRRTCGTWCCCYCYVARVQWRRRRSTGGKLLAGGRPIANLVEVVGADLLSGAAAGMRVMGRAPSGRAFGPRGLWGGRGSCGGA